MSGGKNLRSCLPLDYTDGMITVPTKDGQQWQLLDAKDVERLPETMYDHLPKKAKKLAWAELRSSFTQGKASYVTLLKHPKSNELHYYQIQEKDPAKLPEVLRTCSHPLFDEYKPWCPLKPSVPIDL